MDEHDGLIDHDLIATWHAENVAAAERLVAARLRLAKAESEHVAASHATGRAAANGDERDVLNAQSNLEEAARLLTVSRKVFDSATTAMLRSNNRRDIVRGLAHRGLFEDGVRQRVEAARRADVAREALAAAEADYRAANATLRLAMQNGVSDCHGGALDRADLVRTAQQERRHWTDRGIDPDRPRHPMVEPVALSDEQAHAEGLLKMSKGDDVIHVSPSVIDSHVAAGWQRI